jgi:N-carbamoyl-L-amino-acid hydrolase
VTRLALSPEDREARGLFARLAGEVGLALRIDRFGNMWSRTAHDSWDVPAVVAGSHLDSVPAGGRFDGVVGIVAGLEAIRAISEDGRLPAVPLGVVNFTAEESSRYGIATVGSKAVAGLLAPEEVMALKDRHGTTYAEALSNYGGFDLTGAVFLPPGPVGCYLEMHVEQGKELEIAEMPLGVVKAIAAPTRFRVTVHGEAAHSGATLMTWRKDGLVAASELVLALERIAELEDEYGTVATATIFALHPVSINVVPGRVELGVDIRGIDSGSKHRAVERFHRTVRRVSAQRGILIETELLADEEPVALHPDAVECARLGCERAGLPHMMMQSRAGHDAMNMLHVCPAGMLFVPSRGGISHHPAEYTSMEHIVQGAAALMEAMLAAAAMVQRRQAQGGGSGR